MQLLFLFLFLFNILPFRLVFVLLLSVVPLSPTPWAHIAPPIAFV
ncbi:hypothetical protein [Prosthecobacter sp.]